MLSYYDQAIWMWVRNTNMKYVGEFTTPLSLKPTHQTHRVTRWQTTLHATSAVPTPECLPWESVPKQLTAVRQVHEHRGTPMETGQDLTEQTSQRHQTHYQPKHTWLTGLCIHPSDPRRPQTSSHLWEMLSRVHVFIFHLFSNKYYFILKYCNFIFFFLCRLDYLCLIGPVHT